jgi:hypothetical protein
MLLPFALLPLIGRALPHGHVWPALITLPLTLALTIPVSAVRFRPRPPLKSMS